MARFSSFELLFYFFFFLTMMIAITMITTTTAAIMIAGFMVISPFFDTVINISKSNTAVMPAHHQLLYNRLFAFSQISYISSYLLSISGATFAFFFSKVER